MSWDAFWIDIGIAAIGIILAGIALVIWGNRE